MEILKKIEPISVPLDKFADIFDGIQTSAERPKPIYWFSCDEIQSETEETVTVKKEDKFYTIEKKILKPYFKPTKKPKSDLPPITVYQQIKRSSSLTTAKVILSHLKQCSRITPEHTLIF